MTSSHGVRPGPGPGRGQEGRAHHQGDHDGKAVGDLVGRLDQDDREADGHSDDPAQERCGANQGKGPGVDVTQSNVAGEERNQEGGLGSYWGGTGHTRAYARTHTHLLRIFTSRTLREGGNWKREEAQGKHSKIQLQLGLGITGSVSKGGQAKAPVQPCRTQSKACLLIL